MHDSAVASVSPRSRQASSTSASTGRSSSTNRCRPARSRRPPDELVRARPPLLVDEQVDVDLELARADGRRHAVALAPALGERPRDLGLARPVEAQHAPFGFTRAREHVAHRLRLERARPEPLQLARRPGQHDDRAALGLEHERRRRAGDPDDQRALRQRRLLAHALGEVGVRPLEPLGDRPGDRLDLRLQPLRRRRARARPHARRARPSGRRASARGRPRRSRDRPRAPRAALSRARPGRRRRSRSARARRRAAAAPRRGTARSGRAGRRGRARCR